MCVLIQIAASATDKVFHLQLPPLHILWLDFPPYNIMCRKIVNYLLLFQHLPNTPYVLEEVVGGVVDEPSSEVRLQLLSAVMKMFFKRPPECQEMLGRLLEHSIGEFLLFCSKTFPPPLSCLYLHNSNDTFIRMNSFGFFKKKFFFNDSCR